MSSPAALSGEMLLVRHIPLTHGQSVGCQLYSSVTKPTRPRSLNLTHSASLPERTGLPGEVVQHDGPNQNGKGGSKKEEEAVSGHGSTEGQFDNTSPIVHSGEGTSSSTDTHGKAECAGERRTPRWHNPFLPDSEVEEEDEDEDDSDGDNLHKYREDSSFQLHGNCDGAGIELGAWYDTDFVQNNHYKARCGLYIPEEAISIQDMDQFGPLKECKEPEGLHSAECHERRDSRSTPMQMDSEDQEWENDNEEYGKYDTEKEALYEESSDHDCGHVSKYRPESDNFAENHGDYVSDSSCNSSDGVLVNFSAIYNKTNNVVPAMPLDLDSSDKQSQETGSTSQDDLSAAPCWSPRGLDPNCNSIYPFDSDGLSFLEVPDIASCLQSQARLAASTQNYYKLVSCDLSSQSSPSPAWSSVTSHSEGHSQSSSISPTGYFLFGQPNREVGVGAKDDSKNEEEKKPQIIVTDLLKGKKEMQFNAIKKVQPVAAGTRKRDSPKRSMHPRSLSLVLIQECITSIGQGALRRVQSCPRHLDMWVTQSKPLPRQRVTSFAKIAQCKKGDSQASFTRNGIKAHQSCSFSLVSQNIHKGENLLDLPPQNLSPAQSDKTTVKSLSHEAGACCSSAETVQHTKPQRPTSLPIQPFILQPPTGNQQTRAFGSLLNQYINHKHGKSGASKYQSKTAGLLSHLRPSPAAGCSSNQLEVATSSDSCSTCTPSPPQHQACPRWTQPSPLLGLHPSGHRQSSPRKQVQTGAIEGETSSARTHAGVEQTVSNPTKTCNPKTIVGNLATDHTQDSLHKQISPFEIPWSPSFREELLVPVPLEASDHSHESSSPAVTSVTSLPTMTSISSLPGAGQRYPCQPNPAKHHHAKDELSSLAAHVLRPLVQNRFALKDHHQGSDSLSLTDRPPEEFSLSPDSSAEFRSIDLLQKRDMLTAVSSAVDLITAHFSSCRDPEEKVRLGNSSLCPGVSQLVLEKLCPAIQNILKDGLRLCKLDLIVGQRRNRVWNVVEASIQPGPSTRMLHSLLSVVKKCTLLVNHSMRLNAFIFGLLNLHALEFWIHHLYNCVDVLAAHYHQWGFLPLSRGLFCRSLFQELLLLLQPLSLLPFDLHLLSEARLRSRQEQRRHTRQKLSAQGRHLSQSANADLHAGTVKEKRERATWMRSMPSAEVAVRGKASSPSERLTVCCARLMEDPQVYGDASSRTSRPDSVQEGKKTNADENGETQSRGKAGWWLGQTPVTDGAAPKTPSGSSPESRNKEVKGRVDVTPEVASGAQTTTQGLRWARLFGSTAGSPPKTEGAEQRLGGARRSRLPSQWLWLGGPKLDFLA
ncbi:iporin [Chanos chanos]|uniref:Iporin n=1 Tax=Chanos chanos TaxID=29144 RepID=A0A6J2UY20_CHACN|nr:iporin-like [Chanos chanos]